MKYPDYTPEPRTWHFRERATVVQDDGLIAGFIYDGEKPEDGWVFTYYEDRNGFIVHKTAEDGKWLLENEQPLDRNPFQDLERFELEEDEVLHYYSWYGGPLCARGGYFITKKDNPGIVTKSKMAWIS